MGSEQSLIGTTITRYVCKNNKCDRASEGDTVTYSTIAECQANCSKPSKNKWYIGLFFILFCITIILLAVKGKLKKIF